MRRAALLAILAAAGCAPREAVRPPRGPVVALLPFANESVDLDAPGLAREMTAEGLRARGYRVREFDVVDARLKELGFTDGGQLGALSSERLVAELPADLYAYGTVVDYAVQSAVALTRRIVTLKVRVVDRKGVTVYAGDGKGQESSAGSEAAGALATHLASKMVRRGELRAETKRAVSRMLEGLRRPD